MQLFSFSFWLRSFSSGISSAYTIIKWMIPAVIIVKLLELMGATHYLAKVFSPLMEIIGLPGWTSIVWTTAMLSNLYGGLAVLVSNEGFASLSGAQMSVLGTAMLIAHSLPLEARITQAFGVRFWHIIAFRLGGAFVLCFILNLFYTWTGLLDEQVVVSWDLAPKDSGTSNLNIMSEIVSLISLSLIVIFLVVLIDVLKQIKVVYYCELLLRPLLRFIGISSSLAHIMAVGGLLGLTYGSGLLLAESKKNDFAKKDLAVALVFISMCHALIEDSIIMLLCGADIFAVLFARLFFCLLVAAILMRWRAVNRIKFYHR